MLCIPEIPATLGIYYNQDWEKGTLCLSSPHPIPPSLRRVRVFSKLLPVELVFDKVRYRPSSSVVAYLPLHLVQELELALLFPAQGFVTLLAVPANDNFKG